MSAQSSLVTVAAVLIIAFVLVGQILIGSRLALAGDQWQTRVQPAPATTDPAAAPTGLDERDEIAALERIQYALSEVGDGTTYVWRRWHGHLSGFVLPTTSFKDHNGKVCRHLIVLMTTGKRTSKIEGIACRLASGRWQLDG